MSGRDANQLAADAIRRMIQIASKQIGTDEGANTELNALVARITDLEAQVAALTKERDEYQKLCDDNFDEGLDYKYRAEAAEAALAEAREEMSGYGHVKAALIAEADACREQMEIAQAALATTRQALADFLSPWGPEHYPQLRRALADTGGDTAHTPECSWHYTAHSCNCGAGGVTA